MSTSRRLPARPRPATHQPRVGAVPAATTDLIQVTPSAVDGLVGWADLSPLHLHVAGELLAEVWALLNSAAVTRPAETRMWKVPAAA